MFISEAFAQATDAASGPSPVGTLVQLALIFLVFYLLLIRPQQKKIKQHEFMLTTIKKGDEVITSGGIIAKVIKVVDDEVVEAEISNGVVAKVQRSTIRSILVDEKTVKETAKK